MVVLDDPMVDLDEQGRRTLAILLREAAARGAAVLVITPSRAEVQGFADRIATFTERSIPEPNHPTPPADDRDTATETVTTHPAHPPSTMRRSAHARPASQPRPGCDVRRPRRHAPPTRTIRSAHAPTSPLDNASTHTAEDQRITGSGPPPDQGLKTLGTAKTQPFDGVVEAEPSPLDIQLTRTRLRQLAEQLAMEYAGAVVPGRVMRLVLSTGRRLQHRGYHQDEVLRITKATVRADLVTHIGCTTSATLGAGRREPA